MEENLDVDKLTKLFLCFYNSKIDVEFSDDELNDFNSYIKDKNVNAIIQLFESKNAISYEVLDDMIHSKVESLWQFIIDKSYEKWDSKDMNRKEFLNHITYYERLAVMFGNFNYEVEEGGLYQWHKNGYSEDLDSLYEFLKNSDYDKKDDFLLLLDNFEDIKSAVDKLNCFNDWYDKDCQTRWNSLDSNNKNYYTIKETWNNYFENYLLHNITDEYVDMIINLNESIDI